MTYFQNSREIRLSLQCKIHKILHNKYVFFHFAVALQCPVYMVAS